MIRIEDFTAGISATALASRRQDAPWELVAQLAEVVTHLLRELPTQDYVIEADVAVHRTALIEPGAVLKGPLIVGPHCFVAAGAYLRGGGWLGERCIIGPGAELKTSVLLSGTKLAHFNFVGDSVLGANVNLEAGSIICNYRNERDDKQVRVRIGDRLHDTGCEKFGALLGDGVRLGANAVLAPGAIIEAGFVVGRGEVFDAEAQHQAALSAAAGGGR